MQGTRKRFDLHVAEDMALLHRAFNNVFPWLSTMQVICMDCREFDDPGATAELRRHVRLPWNDSCEAQHVRLFAPEGARGHPHA